METSVITQSASASAHGEEPSQPVANYGLLADCNSAALVDRDGSIDWLCMPRYDSDAVFARLLDPNAGHWSIRPTSEYTAERRYLPGTLVIETTFTTDSGQVRLTDAMAFADGQRGHDLGFDAPHELLRSVEGVSGRVELELELAPRPQYGLVMPLIRLEDGGARTFGAGRITVRSAAPLEVDGATMRASFTVDEGEHLGFSVRWASAEDRSAPEPTAADGVAERIADTVEGWRSWEAEHDIYEGPHRELVRMSSRVLKGLSYRPTGAIVAAPTTSLPETVGGERNWDYRFSWIRDSSLTIEALYIGTCTDEAEEFISFMTSSAGGRAGEGSLQIMYGIGGEHDLSERELPHLRGWRESTPVRVGNGAWDQVQLDVYGELLNSLWLYREQAGRPASRDPGVRGRPRRHRGPALDGDRLRDVGDARGAAPPSVVEGAVLDGARPGGEAGAAARRATPRPRSGRRRATRSAPPSSSAAGARRSRRSRSRSTRTSSTPLSS